jgi:hypothetical protein
VPENPAIPSSEDFTGNVLPPLKVRPGEEADQGRRWCGRRRHGKKDSPDIFFELL